jgi:hypothetical protein
VLRYPWTHPDETPQLSFLPGGVKGGAFHGAHPHPNADGVQIIHHRLPNLVEGGIYAIISSAGIGGTPPIGMRPRTDNDWPTAQVA